MLQVYHQRGCKSLPSLDVFRKRLAPVLLEYSYLVDKVENPAALGVVGWPSGVLQQCSGCWGGGGAQQGEREPLHDLHVDCCFKLPHLRNDKLPDQNLKPANSLFLWLVTKCVRLRTMPECQTCAQTWTKPALTSRRPT